MAPNYGLWEGPSGVPGAAAHVEFDQRRDSHMKLFSAHIEDMRTLYVTDLKKALDMEQKIFR